MLSEVEIKDLDHLSQSVVDVLNLHARESGLPDFASIARLPTTRDLPLFGATHVNTIPTKNIKDSEDSTGWDTWGNTDAVADVPVTLAPEGHRGSPISPEQGNMHIQTEQTFAQAEATAEDAWASYKPVTSGNKAHERRAALIGALQSIPSVMPSQNLAESIPDKRKPSDEVSSSDSQIADDWSSYVPLEKNDAYARRQAISTGQFSPSPIKDADPAVQTIPSAMPSQNLAESIPDKRKPSDEVSSSDSQIADEWSSYVPLENNDAYARRQAISTGRSFPSPITPADPLKKNDAYARRRSITTGQSSPSPSVQSISSAIPSHNLAEFLPDKSNPSDEVSISIPQVADEWSSYVPLEKNDAYARRQAMSTGQSSPSPIKVPDPLKRNDAYARRQAMSTGQSSPTPNVRSIQSAIPSQNLAESIPDRTKPPDEVSSSVSQVADAWSSYVPLEKNDAYTRRQGILTGQAFPSPITVADPLTKNDAYARRRATGHLSPSPSVQSIPSAIPSQDLAESMPDKAKPSDELSSSVSQVADDWSSYVPLEKNDAYSRRQAMSTGQYSLSPIKIADPIKRNDAYVRRQTMSIGQASPMPTVQSIPSAIPSQNLAESMADKAKPPDEVSSSVSQVADAWSSYVPLEKNDAYARRQAISTGQAFPSPIRPADPLKKDDAYARRRSMLTGQSSPSPSVQSISSATPSQILAESMPDKAKPPDEVSSSVSQVADAWSSYVPLEKNDAYTRRQAISIGQSFPSPITVADPLTKNDAYARRRATGQSFSSPSKVGDSAPKLQQEEPETDLKRPPAMTDNLFSNQLVSWQSVQPKEPEKFVHAARQAPPALRPRLEIAIKGRAQRREKEMEGNRSQSKNK